VRRGGVPDPTPGPDGTREAPVLAPAEPAAETAPAAPAAPEGPATVLAPAAASEPAPSTASAPPLVAAIDVGANSTHLLVARVSDRVETVVDESVLLGLGAAVFGSELIPRDIAGAVVETLASYVARSRALGVADPVALGTEPFRRAGNAARVVARIGSEIGVPFHVLDHEEEGLLTLLGAMGGAPLDEEAVVVDIGGGSSEIVVARPGASPVTRGLPLGSAHASAHHIEHDPPRPAELLAIQREAAAILAAAPDARPARIVLVGGTASNLVKVDPAGVGDTRVTRERLARVVAHLLEIPADAVAEQHAIRVQRARILAAGAAIVDAVLDRYGLEEADATDEGIRQGAAIAAARAGTAWRDALPRIVRGG
jgi:exopolyphosphatase/guanosine-5'-triphosphate,3'-diphosphate pyrophosphatase